jgi:ABC-type bacteriocin/lantibiotic exporter with double-glycine peptidase domain
MGMVLAHFGRHTSMDVLRDVSGVSRDCVSAQDLLRIADHFGLVAKVRRCEPEDLPTLGFPVVVYLDFIHFSVVEGLDEEAVQLNDPAYGRYRMPRERFAESYTGIALAFAPGKQFKRGGAPTPVWQRIRRQLAYSEPGLYIAAAAASVFALVPIVGWLIALGIGALTWVGPSASALWGGLAVAAVSVLMAMGGVLIRARLENDFVRRRLIDLPRHLLAQPFAFFVYRLPTVLSNRVIDQEAVAEVLFRALPPAVAGLIALPVLLAAIAVLHVPLGLTAALLVAGALAILILLDRAAGQQCRASQDDGEAQWFKLSHSLENFESFKTSGGDREVFRDLMGIAADKLEIRQRTAFYRNLAERIPDLMVMILLPVALIWLWLSPPAGPGTFLADIAVVCLVVLLHGPLRSIAALHGRIERLQLSLPPIDDLLDSPAEASRPKGMPASDATTDGAPVIALKDVDFGFSRAKPALLSGVSMSLEAGEWLAVTGPSGGGKSTLVGLAIGLHTPWTGTADFAGQPIAALGRAALAAEIGWVNKHPFFTPGSLRDNIRLWATDISDAEIDRAVEDACLADLIESLPGGLDAQLGPRAAMLSGGQRQRVEIARALARRPRLLVLDEATDGLDRETEARLFAAIRRRGVAVLVVSHRASTIAACDRTLRLQDGRLHAADAVTCTVDEFCSSNGPVMTGATPGQSSEAFVDDPHALAAVFHRVAEAAGISISDEDRMSGEVPDPHIGRTQALDALGLRFGVGVRPVRFVVDAWRLLDHGPLIAFRKADGHPVAVLPDKDGGLSAFDPAQLSPTAYTLYPRFKDAPVQAVDFFTHAIRRLHADRRAFLGAGLFTAALLAAIPSAAALQAHLIGIAAQPRAAALWLGGFGLTVATALTVAAAQIRAQGRLEGILELSANNAIFQHVLRLRPLFVTGSSPAAIHRSLQGVPTVLQLLRDGSARRLIAAVATFGCLAVLTGLSPLLALLALALLAPIAGAAALLRALRRSRAGPLMASKAAKAEALRHLLLAAPKHHQAARERSALAAWAAHVVNERRLADPLRRFDAAADGFVGCYPWAALPLFLVAASSIGVEVSLASILAFLLAALSAQGAGEAACAIVRAEAAMIRLRALASAPCDPPPAYQASRTPTTDEPPLRLERVGYSYPGRPDGAVHDVSLTVRAGEIVALTGPTGCGKSTLLRLALGFMPPDTGAILRDGETEATGDLSAWRERIGAVMQDDQLEVAMTIRGHIGGRGGFSLAEVREAARRAQLEADIDAMPMGIQSIVDAERISTGQKQRILIARRLVRNPRLLILDEATNALSDPMQAKLFREIRAMGTACLIVTHRDSALVQADRVYHMMAGRLIKHDRPAKAGQPAQGAEPPVPVSGDA